MKRNALVAGLKKDWEVINLEAAFRTKGGGIRYGLMSASIIDLNGVPHILSITRDITDRKQAENALRESKEEWERQDLFGGIASSVVQSIILSSNIY